MTASKRIPARAAAAPTDTGATISAGRIPARHNDAAAANSRICMEQCRAMCCRGPLILHLEPGEIAPFRDAAADLGVAAQISPAADGGGNLLFLDHPGERCPMLDDSTSACRIYHRRPQCCRDFPRKPEPGCAISGWTEPDALP